MNHQAAYYVFVIILVFQIDALSVHNGKVITNLFLEKVTVNKESHITAAIRTVQGIAAIDTCQIVDCLRITVYQFDKTGRHRILNGVHRFELPDTGCELGQKLIFRIGFQNLSGVGEAVHEVARPFVGNLTACHEYNPFEVESIAGFFAGIIIGISHLGIACQTDTFFQCIHYIIQARILGS